MLTYNQQVVAAYSPSTPPMLPLWDENPALADENANGFICLSASRHRSSDLLRAMERHVVEDQSKRIAANASSVASALPPSLSYANRLATCLEGTEDPLLVEELQSMHCFGLKRTVEAYPVLKGRLHDIFATQYEAQTQRQPFYGLRFKVSHTMGNLGRSWSNIVSGSRTGQSHTPEAFAHAMDDEMGQLMSEFLASGKGSGRG